MFKGTKNDDMLYQLCGAQDIEDELHLVCNYHLY